MHHLRHRLRAGNTFSGICTITFSGICTIACGRETPSNHRTNCNHCNSCRRLRAGKHLQSLRDSSLGEGAFGFLQSSDIGKPSSPRRVAAIADGWCLDIRTAIIFCAHCRLRAGTPSVTCGDSSLQLREPRFVLISRLSKKPSIIYISQFLIIVNKAMN